MEYTDTFTLKLFGNMKQGKGTGPFADTTDIFISVAVCLDDISQQRYYSASVECFMEVVRQGIVPVEFRDAFTSCAFTTLEKSEKDL